MILSIEVAKGSRLPKETNKKTSKNIPSSGADAKRQFAAVLHLFCWKDAVYLLASSAAVSGPGLHRRIGDQGIVSFDLHATRTD